EDLRNQRPCASAGCGGRRPREDRPAGQADGVRRFGARFHRSAHRRERRFGIPRRCTWPAWPSCPFCGRHGFAALERAGRGRSRDRIDVMKRDDAELRWLTERPIAHRGLHDMNRECWENTLPAFERACRKGYAIECDVTVSADGVPVVIHDTNLVRLTGKYGWVYRYPARSIRSMKIGRTGDHVPLLDDLLDLVDGRVPIVIELKAVRRFDGPLVEAVAKALYGYQGN